MGRSEMVVGPSDTAVAAEAVAYHLNDAINWWEDVNRSLVWQNRIFHLLAILYGIVAAVAFVNFLSLSLSVSAFLILDFVNVILAYVFC